MKKLLFAFFFLLTLTLGYAQFGDQALTLPGSVRNYLDEKETMSRLLGPSNTSSLLAMPSRYTQSYMKNGVEMIDAFIAVDNLSVLDVLRAQGVVINCEFDGFVTAQIPVSILALVSKISGVKDVEISKVMDLCTDSTLRVTHAGQVINGLQNELPQNYDGRGVIMGIIDCGFDYRHSAFKSAQDPTKTRIVRVYDPQNTTGHKVILGNDTLKGSVFMGAQIDTMTTDERSTHGTHTASIAAGRHMNGYGGMAPASDIVLCSSRTLNSGISETEVANCIKYIYSYADSVGKPCVISVSVSTSAGAHDGYDYLTRAIKQLVGPGRIFVIAAGNNGSQAYYVHGPATKKKSINILIDCSCYNADDNYFYSNVIQESWIRPAGTRPIMKYHILDKRTNKIVWESREVTANSTFTTNDVGEFFEPDPTVNNTGYLKASISMSVQNSKFVVASSIYNLKSKSYYIDGDGKRISNYRIGMSISPRFFDTCYVDTWMGTGVGRYGRMTAPVFIDSIQPEGDPITVQMDGFYAIPDNSSSIGTYAVSDSVISVGSFAARNSYFSLNRDSLVLEPWVAVGSINSSSSYQSPGAGPTGKHLPTVTAPGYHVIAAGSRYSYFNSPIRSELVIRDDEGSCWGIMSGTSMAAPAVAGIIAQWLQVNPYLSPSQIKNVIAQSAIKDEFTNATVRFGPNGKIDAMAGIMYLLQHDQGFLLGDVNGDGQITIADATMMIDWLLGYEVPGYRQFAQDISQDGLLTIKDVIMVLDILLCDED